jgi:hypothetical protein
LATSKRSAADRTISIFSGKTTQEEEHEARHLKEAEDAKDAEKGGDPSIEANLEQHRESAFACQEWCSKNFGHPEVPGSEWRLSRRLVDKVVPYYYLERVDSRNGKVLSSYSGLMFRDEGDALFGLADTVVKAAREKKNAGK